MSIRIKYKETFLLFICLLYCRILFCQDYSKKSIGLVSKNKIDTMFIIPEILINENYYSKNLIKGFANGFKSDSLLFIGIVADMKKFDYQPIYYKSNLQAYRFIWNRSFDNTISFEYIFDSLKPKIIIKELFRSYDSVLNKHFFDIKMVKYPDLFVLINNDTLHIDSTKDYYKTEIIYTGLSDWKEFNELVNNYDFWNEDIIIYPDAKDGSLWTLEAKTIDDYNIVTHFAPLGSKFSKICLWLINKKEFQKDKIY